MGYHCYPQHIGGFRRFVGKEEKLDRLNEYKQELEQELQAVNERIEAIEKA